MRRRQPRWPKGTPGGGHRPGRGPGRWRDEDTPASKPDKPDRDKPDKPDKPAGPDWADRVSSQIEARRPRDYQPRGYDSVRVNDREVQEVEREDRDNLYQMQGAYDRPELNDALADWQSETQIPDLLQQALRSGQGPGVTTFSQFAGAPPTEVDLGRLAENLRAAIGQGELTDDAELWRGVTLDPTGWEPGQVKTDPGFMAVSMSREHAEGMLGLRQWEQGSAGAEPHLLRVLAPKGTKVAPGASAVSELLLADNRSVRVVSYEPAKPNNNPWTGEVEEGWGETPAIITVELLP